MRALAHWLLEGKNRFGVDIHAWVFMTNHLHLLATPREEGAISKCMQHVGRHYVPYFNHRHERTGTLFEGRFKSHVVETGEYFLQCLRYIELNPVRAGMVETAADYRWSSHGAHAAGTEMALWTPHAEYLGLGESRSDRQSAYRRLCRDTMEEGVLAQIRGSLKKGHSFGTESFRRELEDSSGVPHGPQKRGRPYERLIRPVSPTL